MEEKGCSIYECRPQNCREYPYTDKVEIWTRLINLVENCAVYPVVFEIFESLKKYYRDEFEEYMVEYQELWGDEYSEDECGDMEEWEDEYEFYEQKDWKGLVEYRRQKAEEHPCEPEYQWRLGEAYVLNKEYENAISLLSDLHKRCPDDMDIQYNLLDALFAVGKDEKAVDWIIKPKIMSLDRNTLDYLYNFMKRKRKPRTIHELHLELYNEGYPAFNEDQLMAFLHSDNRFEFTGSEDESHNCLMRVAGKKEKGENMRKSTLKEYL